MKRNNCNSMKTFCAFNSNSMTFWERRRVPTGVFASIGCVAMLFLSSWVTPIDAQTCSNPNNPGSASCTVLYQTSMAYLDKCGIEEYTNATLPLVHMYHHQHIASNISYSNNGYGTVVASSGDDGSTVWSMTAGSYNYLNTEVGSATEDDYQNGMFCIPTNNYTENLTYTVNNSDGRTYTQDADGDDECAYSSWSNLAEKTTQTINNASWSTPPGYPTGGVMMSKPGLNPIPRILLDVRGKTHFIAMKGIRIMCPLM